MEAGILPIKSPARGKRRLAEYFGRDAAQEIAAALALDAVDLATRYEKLDWWVVTDDQEIAGLARSRQLRVSQDDGVGLNHALRGTLDVVAAGGAGSALILPADLPRAREADLDELVDTLETSDVVVVPSGEDGGTNALALTPPGLLEPRFGPGSLLAHVEAAEALGARCTVVASEHLALDLDTYDDVHTFVALGPTPGRAYEVCSRLLPSER